MKRALLAALLAFAPVAAAAGDLFGVYLVASAESPGARKATLHWPGGAVEFIYLDSAPLLDASDIAAADVETAPGGGAQIRIRLTADGARKLTELTSRNVGRRLGIVVDRQLRSAPFISGSVTEDLVVGGRFTPAEASVLAKKLGPPGGSLQAVATARPDAAPDAAALRLLQGTWSVLNVTMNGRVVPDPKLTASTWIFQEGTLTATNGERQTVRYTLRTDGADPSAFRLEPIAPSKEQGGWVIFRRDDERLTLAFFDGFTRRPVSFAPEPKKVVLVLGRKGRTAASSPCEILVAAGISSILSGGFRQPARERRGGGAACVLTDAAGQEVALRLVFGVDRAVFEAEADKLRTNASQAVGEEPELGETAVSRQTGYHVTFLVLEKETLVALVFQLPGAEIGRLRDFARRVLAETRK